MELKPLDSDEALMLRCKQGDFRALETLFKRYEKRIYGFAFSLLRNREDAEDVASETFLRVFAHRHEFEEGRRFSPWAFKICSNLAISRLRQRQREIGGIQFEELDFSADEGSFSSVAPSPIESMDREFTREEVRAAIEALPEIYKLVISLKYLGEMSCKEITETLDISVTNVQTRLQRAREMLRSRLKHLRE